VAPATKAKKASTDAPPPRETAIALNEKDYIRFDPVSEPWNRFALADGTFLNVKFVLLKMIRAGDVAPDGLKQAQMASQIIVVVEAAPNYRGPPGPPLTPQEVESSIEAELAWQALNPAPSVYRFEGTRTLIASISLRRVRRSSRFGPDGDRAYIVETGTQIATMGGPEAEAAQSVRAP
jgi:hypothetical protein